jgi:hypothetical protein
MAYDRFRRERANHIFANLEPKERDEIESQARAKTPGKAGGLLAQTMFELERARITAQRHPKHIPPFEEWQAQPRPN